MSTPLTDNIKAFLDDTDVGVVGVKRKDGRVHLSHVRHIRNGNRLLFTTEPTRLKARAVERDGWLCYAVHAREAPYAGLTLEGPARVLREGIAEPTRVLFATIFGKAFDPMTDEQVLAMNRVIIEFTPSDVYAAAHLEM